MLNHLLAVNRLQGYKKKLRYASKIAKKAQRAMVGALCVPIEGQ